MQSILTEMVTLLTGAITSLGTGIGAGVNNFVSALAVTGTGENQSLSVFMGFVLIFAGIALAVGLTRRIFGWLETLSGRN